MLPRALGQRKATPAVFFTFSRSLAAVSQLHGALARPLGAVDGTEGQTSTDFWSGRTSSPPRRPTGAGSGPPPGANAPNWTTDSHLRQGGIRGREQEKEERVPLGHCPMSHVPLGPMQQAGRRWMQPEPSFQGWQRLVWFNVPSLLVSLPVSHAIPRRDTGRDLTDMLKREVSESASASNEGRREGQVKPQQRVITKVSRPRKRNATGASPRRYWYPYLTRIRREPPAHEAPPNPSSLPARYQVLLGLLKCTVRTLNLALYKHPPRALASIHLLSSFPSLVPQLLLAFPPAASKTTSTLSQRRGRPTCPFDNILYGPSDP